MTIPIEQMMGGLKPENELFFTEQPKDPNMRESTSVWLYEENGEFGFPRFGIEAIGAAWINQRHSGCLVFPGGRVLDSGGFAPPISPFDENGRPAIRGAGPLSFRCIEPFRKWRLLLDGTAAEGTIEQQIAKTYSYDKRIPVKLDVELTMATPCWVQDLQPEKVAKMSKVQADEALAMGIGWRLEHLFRAEGTFTVDGVTRDFKGLGSRIKRQSVRGMAEFRGHCWQSALFPDGRAFGIITYPPFEDGTPAYNDGYIYQNGRMYFAKAKKVSWFNRIQPGSEDVSLELESELGVTRISATSVLNTFWLGEPMSGFNLHQGGVRYTWDDQTAYGMIERSYPSDQITTS